MNDLRLDHVFVFGDQLSFLIAHEWSESDEERDHYLYHLPNADSGWFRVSLMTLRGEEKASRSYLLELLRRRADEEHGTIEESGDNIVGAWPDLERSR